VLGTVSPPLLPPLQKPNWSFDAFLWLRRLRLMAGSAQLNLSLVTCEAASAALLPSVLPASWRGQPEVSWDPDAPEAAPQGVAAKDGPGAQPGPPSRDWLRQFWAWLGQQSDAAEAAALLGRWPLLPTTQGSLLGPRSLAASPALLLPGAEEEQWPEGLQQALTKLGCRWAGAGAAATS
jgi:hypothetical protein